MPKVIAEFDVDDDEETVDPEDPSGLTESAYSSLMDGLIEAGALNIKIRTVRSS